MFLVTTPDSLLLIWYTIMTLFNVGITILLFISYRLTKCQLEMPGALNTTMWIEVVI